MKRWEPSLCLMENEASGSILSKEGELGSLHWTRSLYGWLVAVAADETEGALIVTPAQWSCGNERRHLPCSFLVEHVGSERGHRCI